MSAGAGPKQGDGPSPWLVRFAPLLKAGATVLDVACGRGRNALWLESLGLRVTGIDRDAAALATSGAGERIVFDLETGAPWPLAGRRFDAVIVTHYLHRPLFADLRGALGDGGMLLYETFAAGNGRFGKPTNPAFLLAPGELLARCRGLDIVAFEDGLLGRPPHASIQRICAVAPTSAPETDPMAGERHAL